MKSIKVFYMVYSLTSGGIERYSINLYKYLNKNIVEMDFITKLDRQEFFDDTLYKLGGRKIAISSGCDGSKIRYRLSFLINAFKVSKSDYDIAYFNLSSPSAVFKYPFICRLNGIKKVVIHSHNSCEEKVGCFKKMLNILGRCYINHIATEKFACSDKAAEWMYGKKCGNEKSYVYIKNGLEIDKYRYNETVRHEVRRQLKIEPQTVVIGHVGRFEYQKNHKFLLDVFEQVVKNKSNMLLIMVGVGSLIDEMKVLVEKKGIADNVKFLGERSNVNELFQAMDIFVLPSLYEGLPVVGVEAQASGLRCLFSDTITKEADITGNVQYLPLQLEYWKDAIEQYTTYPRKDVSEEIRNAGYDIESTARIVQSKFQRMMEG